MKHILNLSLMLLFFCNAALKAEPNLKYLPGYVIQLNGDTLKGQLLSQTSKNAGERCVLKTEAGEDKTFLPGEIYGYRYEGGKYFVTKEIQKDSLNKKTVFLEYLIKGITSIYYSFDVVEHYYAEKDGIGLIELTEEEKMRKIDDKKFVVPAQTKGKLAYIMQDCPDVKRDIQNIRLNHNSLKKLAEAYHKKVCNTESCIIYEKSDVSLQLKWNIFAGYSINEYNFGNQVYTDKINNYQIGAGIKLSNIFMFDEHLNIRVNVSVGKDAKYSTVTLNDNVSFVTIEYDDVWYVLNKKDYGSNGLDLLPSIRARVDVLNLNLPITLNKDIPLTKRTTLFCGVGLANKFILSQYEKFQIVEFHKLYGHSINTWLMGVAANVGMEAKWFGNHSFQISAGYEYLQDFRSTADQLYKLHNNQFSIQLGVLL